MSFGKMGARGGFGSQGVLGGAQQPPAGHFFLRGENADTSHTVLRGQTSTGVYVNLSGK